MKILQYFTFFMSWTVSYSLLLIHSNKHLDCISSLKGQYFKGPSMNLYILLLLQGTKQNVRKPSRYKREFKIQNSCRNHAVVWGCMFCWQKNKHFMTFWWQVKLLGNWDHHDEVWENALLSSQISLASYVNVALDFHRTHCPNTANENWFLI